MKLTTSTPALWTEISDSQSEAVNGGWYSCEKPRHHYKKHCSYTLPVCYVPPVCYTPPVCQKPKCCY